MLKNLCIHILNLCSKYLPSQQPNEDDFCINCELKISRNKAFKFISFKNSRGFYSIYHFLIILKETIGNIISKGG